MEQPEVRAAKTLANQQYVQMDELMAAAGKRLAELTGAEWGMVSAGCAAAISHATAACIAGGNPDLHIRIPDLRGFPKDEVIIPTESRNSYDAAITAVGAKLIEVDSMDALKLAIGPKTAMIYVEGGTGTDSGPMSVEAISAVAKQHNVPVLVDAAPEILTVLPNVHLQRGATLVAYSGGKVIRGPQSAGLLLGRKDLVQAAWVHSAPHHGYARSMKIGREEIVGMVVAVENYVKRDHDAEWKEWVGRCDHIANRLTKIPGVVANVRREPGGRGNRSPRVSIAWDSKKLNITGAEVTEILDTTEPRIVLGGGGGGRPGQPQEAGTDTSI
jgi:D-glucosaminate-6-phosphate ammonia-lyase